MKKSNILIAAFVVVSTASAARAEIDFDGRTSGSIITGSQALAFENTLQVPVPDPVGMPQRVFGDITEVDKTATFIELPGGRRGAFRQLVSTYDKDSAKLIPLIDNKNIKILCGPTGILFLGYTEGKYWVVAESNNRELLMGAGNDRKAGKPVCKFVEYVLWKLVEGVWTEVIEKVKECYSDTDTSPYIHAPGSGSTYHNGQGGNTDYDVNKLKR